MTTTNETKQERYKVVKIMRISGRRQVIRRNITNVEDAGALVKLFPDSSRSMVVYYSY